MKCSPSITQSPCILQFWHSFSSGRITLCNCWSFFTPERLYCGWKTQQQNKTPPISSLCYTMCPQQKLTLTASPQLFQGYTAKCTAIPSATYFCANEKLISRNVNWISENTWMNVYDFSIKSILPNKIHRYCTQWNAIESRIVQRMHSKCSNSRWIKRLDWHGWFAQCSAQRMPCNSLTSTEKKYLFFAKWKWKKKHFFIVYIYTMNVFKF